MTPEMWFGAGFVSGMLFLVLAIAWVVRGSERREKIERMRHDD